MNDKDIAAKLDEVQNKLEQTREKLDDLEKRLHTAFEQWLKRIDKQA